MRASNVITALVFVVTLLFLCLILGTSAFAQSQDNTVPAAPYYSVLISGENQPGIAERFRFPLESKLLQPGVLRTEGTSVFSSKWMTQSIALVGDDLASRQWLELHLLRLRTLGASVIVVQAASVESFKDLQRLASGLSIVPVSGTWLQSRLAAANTTVYPLFIGLDGKARQHIFGEGFPDAFDMTEQAAGDRK